MPAQVTVPSGSISIVELLTHATRTASGTGSGVELAAEFRWIVFELVCTAAPNAGTTLDCWVQQSWDGGVNWDDLGAFGQVAGGSPTVRYLSAPVRVSEGGAEEHQESDAGLGASVVRATVVARRFRVKWVVAGAGPSFSLQVLACPRWSRA